MVCQKEPYGIQCRESIYYTLAILDSSMLLMPDDDGTRSIASADNSRRGSPNYCWLATWENQRIRGIPRNAIHLAINHTPPPCR